MGLLGLLGLLFKLDVHNVVASFQGPSTLEEDYD